MTNQGGGNGIASVASLALDRLDANSSVVGKADAQPTPVLDLKHNGEAVGRWKDEKRASATGALSKRVPIPWHQRDGMQMTDSSRLASPGLTTSQKESLSGGHFGYWRCHGAIWHIPRISMSREHEVGSLPRGHGMASGGND